ncbi:pyridoxal phosphate-dependent aminotransferase [Acetobacter cibinongensis]|uniref:pyridoxal phosphate-dependent aminotransferase n=1 Tax=Acetobacter cibinongensis TaxID=146475 RepID=UPI001F0AB76B|nr:pyridoxal phosphate-dependent aminotransferase [Acetobacter cibinongensis]
MIRLSHRSVVAPFHAIDIMSEALKLERSGQSIIHLAIGQPSAPTPQRARIAASEMLSHGRIGYTEALGIPALRARIAHHYQETYSLDISPERVAVTTGSSAAFTLAFLALFDVGDCVAIPTPGYPAYRNILKTLGLDSIEIPTTHESRWTVTPEQIAQAYAKKPLKGIVLASPNNPDGTMMRPDRLEAVVNCCADHGIRLIMDEIYHGLVYDFPTVSALKFSDDAIVINSFSKYYCMTGWRIGWMIMPEGMARTAECLAQNLALSVNELSQITALAAFDAEEELEAVKAGYADNREYLLRRLPEIGLTSFHPPDGGFFIYTDVSHLTDDSMIFARDLLHEAGVSVAPGIDFDRRQGSKYIRLSFAGKKDDIEEGCQRIADFIAKKSKTHFPDSGLQP